MLYSPSQGEKLYLYSCHRHFVTYLRTAAVVKLEEEPNWLRDVGYNKQVSIEDIRHLIH